MTPQELQERIDRALECALRFGGIEGDHHRTWVIDQMVRSLLGCDFPPEEDAKNWPDLAPNDQYNTWVREACDGEDGPDTYTWETGIAP